MVRLYKPYSLAAEKANVDAKALADKRAIDVKMNSDIAALTGQTK